MGLIVLIAVPVWLFVVVVVLAACRSAAQGDAALRTAGPRPLFTRR